MQKEEQRDRPDDPGGEDEPKGMRGVSEAGRARLSQRTSRKRSSRLRVTPGRATITQAAPTPPKATRMNPALTPRESPGSEAAAAAIGTSARVSTRPSVKSERQIVPIPAGQFGYRRTIATRTASSKRPGSATPIIDAPPPAAARESAPGRSPTRKRCRQPRALRPKATRKRTPTTAITIGFPPERGHPSLTTNGGSR